MQTQAYQYIRQTKSLPSPGGTALEILRIADAEEATVSEVADIVEKDPATAARLLKFVNSPFAGVARQIVSVRQAVALIGTRTVKQIALGFSLVSQNMKGACKQFDYDGFWSECLARATAARSAAHHTENLPPEEAFCCGLLCQIGRLAFATAYPDAYGEVLAAVDLDEPRSLLTHERAVFDLDHNEIAAEMMADWRLPEAMCAAVRSQDSPDTNKIDQDSHLGRLALILQLSTPISMILTQVTVHRDTLALATLRANRLGIGPDIFASVFDSITDEWAVMGPIFGVSTRRVLSLAEIYSHLHPK